LACKTDRIDAWQHRLARASQPRRAALPAPALVEAAVHDCHRDVFRDRYERNKLRLGKQRGAKVAPVDVARRISDAIWHMLTRNEPFAPASAKDTLVALTTLSEMRHRSEFPYNLFLPTRRR
jgi:cob(I)alamin adenosyltransferase